MGKKSPISKFMSGIEHLSITDPNNEQIIEWSKLRSSNEIRKNTRLFQVEGIRAVEWFFEYTDFEIVNFIIATEDVNRREPEMQKRIITLLEKAIAKKIPIAEVKREVFRKLADVNKPRGIMIIAKHNVLKINDLIKKVKDNSGIAIVTVGINDPGNMGTIMRSGVAFGATAIFALEGSVDPYNPKVLRASTGHLLPSIRSEDWNSFKIQCKKESINIIALDINKNDNVSSNLEDLNIDKNQPIAICIGSEGKGFPEHIKNFDQTLQIPMSSKAESLNAGVAASLILWYLRR